MQSTHGKAASSFSTASISSLQTPKLVAFSAGCPYPAFDLSAAVQHRTAHRSMSSGDDASSPVLVEHVRDAGVAIVKLNRPKALNAISKSLSEQLAQALAKLRQDSAVKAIVITGSTLRAFSAGVDLK